VSWLAGRLGGGGKQGRVNPFGQSADPIDPDMSNSRTSKQAASAALGSSGVIRVKLSAVLRSDHDVFFCCYGVFLSKRYGAVHCSTA
jgi:hypothetical protein